eukprot:Clim_evm42s144 gene=Clim_evmTU42s144
MLSVVRAHKRPVQALAAAGNGVIQGLRSYASTTDLKKTCLYDFHLEHGGKMVEFAGYAMPVQYGDLSHKESHMHTRTKASLFDVSHMLQLTIHGKDRTNFLEKLVVGDIKEMTPNTGALSLMTNTNGGIIDDTVISNAGDFINMVANAGCADKDRAHMLKELHNFPDMDAGIEFLDGRGLLALQGPAAAAALETLIQGDLNKMPFMGSAVMDVAGISQCRITRCGYTGEDGFEISVDSDRTADLANALLKSMDGETVKLAGLGARDSLRLEAGLCLYGQDMDETTTPIEAALKWTIGKRRLEEGGFLGADVILPQAASPKIARRTRVGLVIKGSPARTGSKVFAADGTTEVGTVTSGIPSPCTGENIAMAYINKPHHKKGTELKVQVRKKFSDATVTKMPWVPHNYHRI